MSFLLHTSGSVGALGEQSPGATRPVSSPVRPHSLGPSCGSSWSWSTGLPPAFDDGDDRVSQVPRGSLVIIRPVLRPRRDQAG